MKREDDEDAGLHEPPLSDAGAATASKHVALLQC